jgi:hypothetical protein
MNNVSAITTANETTTPAPDPSLAAFEYAALAHHGSHPALNKILDGLTELAGASLDLNTTGLVILGLTDPDEGVITLIGDLVKRLATTKTNPALASLDSERQFFAAEHARSYAEDLAADAPHSQAGEVLWALDTSNPLHD